MIVTTEWIRIWTEMVVPYLKQLPQHLLRETGKPHEGNLLCISYCYVSRMLSFPRMNSCGHENAEKDIKEM
jgi:hypothetical protein